MAQFGRLSRREFIRERLREWGPLTPDNAWKSAYRLLSWIDDHSSLLHIYDSHKVERGMPWFLRSRIATEILCAELNLTHDELMDDGIDILFREYKRLVVRKIVPFGPPDAREVATLAAVGSELNVGALRTPDDLFRYPVLSAVFLDAMRQFDFGRVHATPQDALNFAQLIVCEIETHNKGERARQNMLGEGFEDFLYVITEVLLGALPLGVNIFSGDEIVWRDGSFCPAKLKRQKRKVSPEGEDEDEQAPSADEQAPHADDGLSSERDADGKTEVRKGEHHARPDFLILNQRTKSAFILSVKWSLRQDRLSTLLEEVEPYKALFLPNGWTFSFNLLINDFDLGRIDRILSLVDKGREDEGKKLFRAIYHLNPTLLERVHRLSAKPTKPTTNRKSTKKPPASGTPPQLDRVLAQLQPLPALIDSIRASVTQAPAPIG